MKCDPFWLELNRRGLIPGPGESSDQFIKRAEHCLNLKEELTEDINALFKECSDEYSKILEQANIELSLVADLNLDWTLLFFSNNQLSLWHGGCAWIFQLREKTPTAAFIQLRKAFLLSSSYLKIYDRGEILRHELIHVSRMAFQEPKYEEFLAYHTSHSTFRKWWGPIIRSSKESLLLLFILAFTLVFDLFLMTVHYSEALQAMLWFNSLPLTVLLFAIGRLWISQRRLKNCFEQLQKCLHDQMKASAVFYRLTDDEIDAFSKMSPEQILSYGLKQAENELRWKVIYFSYFV